MKSRDWVMSESALRDLPGVLDVVIGPVAGTVTVVAEWDLQPALRALLDPLTQVGHVTLVVRESDPGVRVVADPAVPPGVVVVDPDGRRGA